MTGSGGTSCGSASITSPISAACRCSRRHAASRREAFPAIIAGIKGQRRRSRFHRSADTILWASRRLYRHGKSTATGDCRGARGTICGLGNVMPRLHASHVSTRRPHLTGEGLRSSSPRATPSCPATLSPPRSRQYWRRRRRGDMEPHGATTQRNCRSPSAAGCCGISSAWEARAAGLMHAVSSQMKLRQLGTTSCRCGVHCER